MKLCEICGKELISCNGTSNFWCENCQMHFFIKELDKFYVSGEAEQLELF